jgi:hypothetical protein
MLGEVFDCSLWEGLPGRRVDGVELAKGLALLFDVDLEVVEGFLDCVALLSEFLRVSLLLMLPNILRSMMGCGGEK